jgi:hypothetical protein
MGDLFVNEPSVALTDESQVVEVSWKEESLFRRQPVFE